LERTSDHKLYLDHTKGCIVENDVIGYYKSSLDEKIIHAKAVVLKDYAGKWASR
jgi:hypothetical protein